MLTCIWEQVSQATGPVGPEVKVINLPKPGKYSGQDDLEKFDQRLSHLLKYNRTFKVTGPDRDEDRVLYTGLYLKGLATQWYDQEVQDWTFEDNAVDQFDHTRFSHEKGALAYYNDLKCCACRMVQPLDDYSFRRKFLHGLPHSIIRSIHEARGISTKHSTIEEILKEVWHMETAQKAINIHEKESRNPTKGSSPRYV
ncbi:hypothetical protein EV363DRAFT_1398917 [Boletus edulis]|nr:hypothetical protein EV363DRAFT_1398917 [Boletus edulis]